MSQAEFEQRIAAVTARIAGLPVEAGLAATFAEAFPPGGEAFDRTEALCRQGIADCWLCWREAGGIRFARAGKPVLAGIHLQVAQHPFRLRGEAGSSSPAARRARRSASPAR